MILNILTSTYILVYFLILVLGFFKKTSFSKIYYVITFLFVLSIAYQGYRLDPSPSLDLYRLQQEVDLFRISDRGFIRSIFPNFGNYRNLATFNFLCYLVSKLDNNSWLSFISVLIVFGILGWISVNFVISEKLGSPYFTCAFILIFTGMQIQYIFSGVRNAIAVSLTALAMYLYLYKHKHFIGPFILFVLAVFMHPIVIVAPLVYCAAHFRFQLLLRCIVLFSLSFAFALAPYLIRLPIPFLQYVGDRLLFYTELMYQYDRPELIANLIIFIVIGSLYWFTQKLGTVSQSSSREWTVYSNFYYLLGFMMIGCVMHRDIALRLGYMMGATAVPMLCQIRNTSAHIKGRNAPFASVLIFAAVSIVSVCSAKVFYDTLYTISRWNFS